MRLSTLFRFAAVCPSLCISTACINARPPDLSPAARRAMLLEPLAPYWDEPAPALYTVAVQTSQGEFLVDVNRSWAPLGADRFYRLVLAGYYDDSRFTRVVPNFIAQFGIAGDSLLNALWHDATFPDDSVRHSNTRGTIAFAMTGPGRRTTQLFVSLVDNSRLDAQGFAPIGRVVQGMDVVDRLYSGYGEGSGGGVRAGKQGPLLRGGNDYIDRQFPKLDRLDRALIIRYRDVPECIPTPEGIRCTSGAVPPK